ncbi:MAG TPA: hypothetical protein DCG75_17215 [Bacteroidales bacterium]|nr:hypothetical protein [Bacteroidales bacterium]
MKKALYLILIIIFFSVYSLSGQQFYTRNYTINNGLPSNCIRDIYKDSRDFLWLGTDAGLSRFDGKDFTIYTSQDGLSGDKIWSITESEEGNIWIGTHDGGISEFNGKEIVSYNTESGLISNEVRKLHYSNKFKLLLIGTEDGLSIYSNHKFISFHQKLNNVNQRLQINGFLENDEFIYVFTNGNGLYKYIPQIESLIRIPADQKINNHLISSAYISGSGDTLINFKRNSLLSIKKNKKNITDLVGHITDYVTDNNNNIWISAWNNNYLNAGGLFKFDSTGVTNFTNYLGIKTKNVLSLEFDSKVNLLWIGTEENGLYLYPITNFTYYKATDFNLSELNITDLNVDNENNLWIVTEKTVIKKFGNGSYKIYPFELFKTKFNLFTKNTIKKKYSYLIDQSGSFEKYNKLISSGLYPFANPYAKIDGKILTANSLYKPLKYDILVNKKLKSFTNTILDSKGNIWVGSNVGVFKIDKKTNQLTFFDLEGTQFTSFAFDKEDKIYGVSWADLYVYPDIEHNSNYYLYNYYESKTPINITKIKEQNEKLWFVSADYGLFVSKNTGFYSTYDQNIFDNQSFNDICFDNFGNIIIGGNNGKIYVTELVNDSLQTKFEIDNKKGLLGTSIRWLNNTQDNLLIAGTNSGLNIVDLNKLYTNGRVYLKTFNKHDGFIDYSGKVSIIQNDKKLWVGSNSNLISVDLENLLKENDQFVNFFIKSIAINDEILDVKNLEKFDLWTNLPKTTITLPYYKNSISFNFDVIEYIDPDKIAFQHKLEGYQRNWIFESKDRKIVFQNLKPGKYRLRIKVARKDGDISNQELSIPFIILAPFYLKWWFISLGLGFILFLIWLLIYVRTKTVKKRERQRSEIAERISEFEMKALRAQMNPHFIFNAINSIQNYMLDNDIDSALSHLSDFAKLIRLTLDNVSKKKITLDEELNYLKYYIRLEQMRFDKKFETQIILPPEYENSKIIIPSMILQPYVENSIKHGFVFKENGGKIKLEFLISKDNILKCIIEDNGVGRKKSRELNKSKRSQQSKGTFITKERLSLLNQTQERKGYKVDIIDLHDEYNLASGTRVEIFIPL